MRISQSSTIVNDNKAANVRRALPIGWWRQPIFRGGLILLLTLIGLIWLVGAWAKTNLAQQYPPPGRLIDVGGYKLHLD